MLSRLEWDVAGVVASDYISHVLERLRPLLIEYKAFRSGSKQAQQSRRAICSIQSGSQPSQRSSTTKTTIGKKRTIEEVSDVHEEADASRKYIKCEQQSGELENEAEKKQTNNMLDTVRRHANTFIALCAAGK